MTSALLAAVMAAAAPSSPPVDVSGGSTCPTAADVAARLRDLLPPREGATRPPRTARVEQEPAGVRVTVREPEGAVVVDRLLPPGRGCEEAAAAAALTIAAWELEGRSEPAPLLPAPEPKLVAPAPAPVVAAPPWSYDLGLGYAASRAGSWQGGLVLRAAWTPRGRGLGMGVVGGWEAERVLPLRPGRLFWARWTAGASGHYRWGGPALMVEVRAEAAVAFVALRGDGFPTNLTSLGVSPGASGGTRLIVPFASWLAGFVDASAVVWLRRQTALQLPDMLERDLPRLALAGVVGLAAGRFR
jgi:hypothetical protein